MSEISKQALKVDNTTSFPNNTTGYISPTILRAFNVNVIDSTVNQVEYTTNSGSWNVSIGQLNAFTASQQPSFTALNSFTASQLTINTGVNQFTQSTTGRLNALENDTANLELFTSSINQILVNGVSIGTSTRLFFNGFVSASIVPNIDGAIASITVLSDPSLLTTASFNAYSQSVAVSFTDVSSSLNEFSASQYNFNQSATASIVELLNLSSSLSGGYATQGELDQSASVLQNNINTVNGRVDTLSSFTGSYATTGSNTFVGNQIINGAVSISSSATYDIDVTGSIQATTQIRVSGSTGIGNIGAFLVSHTSVTSSIVSSLGKGLVSSQDVTGAPTTFKSIQISANPSVIGVATLSSITNPSILTPSSSIGGYIAPIQFQDRSGYTDGRVTFTTPISASAGLVGNTIVIGSLTITGSVYGNVSASIISSQTASIDLSVANYFTLTLSGSTRLNITNPQPGVTATLVINTSTDASASFSSNVKQPSGSFYAASPSGNIDIISFTAVDSTTVFAFPAQSFV
jgi:hypothetical protein